MKFMQRKISMSSSLAPGRARFISAFGGSMESGKSAATALDLDDDESTAPVQGENIGAAPNRGQTWPAPHSPSPATAGLC